MRIAGKNAQTVAVISISPIRWSDALSLANPHRFELARRITELLSLLNRTLPYAGESSINETGRRVSFRWSNPRLGGMHADPTPGDGPIPHAAMDGGSNMTPSPGAKRHR